jgi:putative spermidine/putrescine transport system substrate-binding protein
VLTTSEGADRAFRKLDQLKPYIVWWQDGSEAAHILASGDVLMSSAPSARIAGFNRAEHRNFGIQWTASLYDVQSWAILKGSQNLRQATQFLYFIGTPAIQARLVGHFGEGGWAKGANDGLPPEVAQLSPTLPANLSAAVRMDGAFWHDNLARLHQRFDAWLAH